MRWQSLLIKYYPNKVIKFILDTTFFVLIFLLIFVLYGILPNRWYQILVVYSGSMSPTFKAGDAIVITRPPENLSEGMVLTFMVNGDIVTHRYIKTSPEGKLITKGDANSVTDDWDDNQISVRGLYKFRIPYLGFALQYLRGLDLHPGSLAAFLS